MGEVVTSRGRKAPVSVEEDIVSHRFWSKVDKNGAGGCWVWRGAKSKRYGIFYLNGKKEKAHRLAWLFTHGSIPPDKMACHKCDNPPCVNPDHIFWGTMSDNIRDCVAKGRHVYNGTNQNKTHCPKGHPLSGANLAITTKGFRYCRECKTEHNKNRGPQKLNAAQKARKIEWQRNSRARAALEGEKP